jgi:hypothetical protein
VKSRETALPLELQQEKGGHFWKHHGVKAFEYSL